MILKACNWNITSKTTPVYSEKINLPSGFPFKGYLRSSAETSWQDAHSFQQDLVLPILSLYLQLSSIISPEHIRFCISLLDRSLLKLSIFLFHEKLSINSELFCGGGQYVLDIYDFKIFISTM